MNKLLLWNWLVLALSGILLTGCIESDDHYILNPDGSGKIEHQAKFVMVDINLGGKQKPVEERAKAAIKKMLLESGGVDAWKDVSYTVEPDGRVAVTATAYFSDLSQVKLKHGGTTQDLLSLAYSSEGGKGVLRLDWPEPKKTAKPKAEATDTALPAAERLAAERGKYQQMKPMMAAMLGNMQMHQKFTLPAPVKSVSNMQQDAGAVRIHISGAKMLETIDGFISDDQWMLEQMDAGKSMGKDFTPDATLNEKLFGAAGEIMAKTSGSGEPQFDYQVEMEAAREAMPAMMEALGFAGESAMAALKPAATGEGFEKLMVGGIRLVKEVGDNKVRPFNWNPGLSISLTGTFPGSVLEVKSGKITQAETLEGESLLLESEIEQQIRFANLSDDGSMTTFEVNLLAPQGTSQGMQRLAGTLEYHTSSSTREVDLGLSSLATGTQSKELGAVIGKYSENQWGGKTTYQATLELEVAVGQVKEVRFLDAAGQALPGVRKSGHSGFNDSFSLNFSSQAPFPEKGNIIVVLHDGLEKYEIPFEIGPFDWLGQSISP